MNATDRAEMKQQALDCILGDLYATLNEDGSYTFVEAEDEMFDLREEEDGQ